MSTALWLPPGADPGALGHTGQWEASDGMEAAEAMKRRLRDVDERLDIVWVKRDTTIFPKGARFYFVRWNEITAPSFWLIEDEDEGYSEPTERHFEKLMEGDTARHPNVWRKYKAARLERERQAAKRDEEKSREFREKLSERLKFDYDTPSRPRSRGSAKRRGGG